MQGLIYFIIFIIGCFFGSFFTLAVYRLPKKEDIFIKHSYCPNCNHKLGFLDLFPILSYLFLRGKCRYCKTRIRPRYFLLELLSGISFLLLAISLKINLYNLNIIYLFASFIYIAILFIIAGIDIENKKIQSNVLIVGFVLEVTYIIYQCTLEKNYDVYKYVMYLLFMIILLIISIISLKRNIKQCYWIQILFLSFYMIIFTGSICYILSVILTLLIIAFYKAKNKKDDNLPIGFYLSVSNIIVLIITNIICHYII